MDVIRVVPQVKADRNVEFRFGHQGNALVAIQLTLGNGVQLFHPDGRGKETVRSVQLPPGNHVCVVEASAHDMNVFGRSYALFVKVEGQLAIEAKGTVPRTDKPDTGFNFFNIAVS